MQCIRGWHNLGPEHKGCVATIGNFDGVHRGHQAVLARLRDEAQAHGCPSLVIIFEPSPQEFFCPDGAPVRITRLKEKLRLLRQQRVDRVLCLTFNPHLANLPAQEFIEQLLVRDLGVRYLLVGDDFRFGRKREGDLKLLLDAGFCHGFGVDSLDSFCLRHQRISSTSIREALRDQDLELARQMLGRPVSFSGKVIHGDKLGRKLGFPTANLALKRRQLPLTGVFAATVTGGGLVQWPAVANLGSRPTVDGRLLRFEVHLLDYQGNLYGKELDVELCQPLRSEQKFDGLDALVAQIGRDIDQARQWLKA